MRFTHLVGLFLACSVSGCMAAAPKSAAPPPSPAGSVVVPEDKAAVSDAKKPPKENKPPLEESGKDTGKKEGEKKGNMWGDQIGDSFGAGGLGLTGTGPGGGGTGEGGIGLGSIGTIGHGAGTGTGSGYGSGGGSLGGSSGSKGRVAAATATTSGAGLATEIIARVVRRNILQIQYCYEKAMAKLPTLAGKVAVKFVIDGQGAVSSADGSDTNITDAEMVSCVCGVVKKLTFPAPSDGSAVVVTYPFNFSPGDP